MSTTTTKTGSTTPPAGAGQADPSYDRRWLILGLVLIAQFIVSLDATIVTVALPSIQTGLGFHSQLDLEWVINAYSLLFGGFLLLGGRAGDLFGRQRLFVAGLVLFTAASLVNGLAQSPGTLIAGRAVQGLGAAAVSPAVLSIILFTFGHVTERTKALAYFTTVTAGGSAAGMLAGGVLTDLLNWRWIFLVNIPIGIVGLIGAVRAIPNARGTVIGPRSMDVPGALTVTGGLTLLVYTIVNAGNWGWGSARTVWLFVASAVLLLAFIAIEARTRRPLVRLGIFKARSLTVANLTMFLMVGGMFVYMFFPTLYMAQVKHYSPIQIGLAYLPWPVAMAVASTMGHHLIKRTAPKVPLVIGIILVAAGLFLSTGLSPDSSYVTGVLPGLVINALGAGLAWSSTFLVASAGVRPEESGLASGIINTSQRLGSALGLAVVSSVAAAYTSSLLAHAGAEPSPAEAHAALVDGFQRGYLLAGAFVAVGAALAFFGLRRSDGAHPRHAQAVVSESTKAINEPMEEDLAEAEPPTM